MNAAQRDGRSCVGVDGTEEYRPFNPASLIKRLTRRANAGLAAGNNKENLNVNSKARL